jgi:antitoxin ParD1/3/4
MQVALNQNQEKFVIEKIKQGKYRNVDELLTVAFELLEERDYKEQKLAELREALTEGTQQIRDGNVVDGEIVFQQLQEKLNQMEKS